MILAARMLERHGRVVAAALLLICSVQWGRAEVVNRVVATIDGDPVTARELARFRSERKAESLSEEQLLQALITDRLLEKEVTAKGITARPEDIEKYVQEVKTRSRMDDARFAQALGEQGLTLETYRQQIKREIEKSQLIAREVRQRVTISPEEIQRYYDAHAEDFGIAERVSVGEIVLKYEDTGEAAVSRARAKAQEVCDLAHHGSDFARLAEQFSDGPAADKGGELGIFSRGEMTREFDDVVFRLKPGEVSDPIMMPGALHIFKVRERLEANRKPLADVKDEIEDKLYSEALEGRFEQWMSKDLFERHHVEVLR